jgi:hypothetical protein
MSGPQAEGFEDTPLPPFGVELGSLAMETSAQHRANLIFLSYRFSQGGIGTQNRMLLYIEENFHPGLMGGEQAELMKARTHRIVGRYFLDQRLHPATAIPWEDDSPEAAVKTERLVTNELAGLFERFEDREQIANFTSDIAGIGQSVIVMDTDYLSRPGGRAGDSEDLKIVVSPYNRDPYDSLFIKYSVLGTSTNTTEFDDIFQRLATEETMCQFDQYTLRQLQFVIDVYARHHPEAEQDERLVRVKTLCAELLHGQ